MSKFIPVTERDFRMPEFRDENPNDYEFRDDGKIVRKDRWQRGIRSIAEAVGMYTRSGYEIDDVVERVRNLIEPAEEGFDMGIEHAFLMARRFSPVVDDDLIPF